MKHLIILLALTFTLFSCGTAPEITEYEAHLFISEYPTSGTVVFDVMVVRSNPALPEKIDIEFGNYLEDVYFFNQQPRNLFHGYLTKDGDVYILEAYSPVPYSLEQFNQIQSQ